MQTTATCSIVSSPATMRAVVRERYGGADALALRDVPLPVPRADEVLIRVRASSVNYADGTGRRYALAELVDAGHVTPIIDRRYTLSQAPEALRDQLEGRTRGKCTITI